MPAESPHENINGFQVFQKWTHILIVFLGASWKDSANSNRSLLEGIPQKPTLMAWTSTSSYFRGSLGSCLSHSVGGPVWHQEGLGVRHAEHPQLCLSVCVAPISWISLIRTVSPGPGSTRQTGHGCVQILTGHVCAQVPSRLNLFPSSLIPHPHSRDSDCPWWEKTSELGLIWW